MDFSEIREKVKVGSYIKNKALSSSIKEPNRIRCKIVTDIVNFDVFKCRESIYLVSEDRFSVNHVMRYGNSETKVKFDNITEIFDIEKKEFVKVTRTIDIAPAPKIIEDKKISYGTIAYRHSKEKQVVWEKNFIVKLPDFYDIAADNVNTYKDDIRYNLDLEYGKLGYCYYEYDKPFITENGEKKVKVIVKKYESIKDFAKRIGCE